MRRLISSVFLNLFHLSSVLCYSSNYYHDNYINYGDPNHAHLLTNNEYSPRYSHDDSPNLKVFYYGERPHQGENVLKNLNLGYLNAEQPISSLDDLYSINSEEIGVPLVPTPSHNVREEPKLWNVEEVRQLGPPQVLPDVGLNLGPDPSDYPVKPVPQVLDEHEIQLGRRVIDDVPSSTDVLNREKSLRQEVKDMGRTEIGENYQRSPEYYTKVPSVVVSNVVQRREPSFMDELRAIKMNKNHYIGPTDDFCEAPGYVEVGRLRPPNPPYMNEPEDSELGSIQIDKSKPVFEKQPKQIITKKCHNENPLPLYIDELKQLKMDVIQNDNTVSDFIAVPKEITIDNAIDNEKPQLEVTTNKIECLLDSERSLVEGSNRIEEYSTVCPAHGNSTQKLGNITVVSKPEETIHVAVVPSHKPVEHTSTSSKQRMSRKRPRKHKTRTPQTTPKADIQSQEESKREDE